jgi:two-component system OmpR family sensor kinase
MQARIAEYVRERTAMVAAIAHDLRTPLARIAFRIEGAPEAVRDPVHTDIREMTAMIATTLEYAKGVSSQGERSDVDVGSLLDELVASARDMGRPVDITTPAPRSAVRGDAVALRRLFQNLIDNALAFAGRATVETAREPGTLVVRVADRGPGCRTTCWSACSSRFVVTSLHATAPRAASDSG